MSASGLEIPTPLQKGKKAAMVTTCNAPSPISQLSTQSKGTLNAMEAVLNASGYTIIGSITLDGIPFKNEIPLKIQNQAQRLSMSI